MNSKSVLIVDDSEFDRGLLQNALKRKAGFAIFEANNAEQCFETLKAQSIDLVLLDIVLPGLDGNKILSKIREHYNPIELPIIMVTAKSEDSEIVSCLRNGANDFITKPVNFEVAISRISTHLKLAETSLAMSKLKEIAALDAMITTYNHEINNPLAIALSCLNDSHLKESSAIEKLKSSLWRIADVVKKIREITEKKETEYGDYVGSTKMFKIK